MDKASYHFTKLARRKTGYPFATIAYYGPDLHFASKVVIGIQRSEKEGEVTELRKWFAKDQDVREDAVIFQEMVEYIITNNAHRVAIVDRIIGCPHEEGVDYPVSESCPQCPFWKNRDRWTGDLID